MAVTEAETIKTKKLGFIPANKVRKQSRKSYNPDKEKIASAARAHQVVEEMVKTRASRARQHSSTDSDEAARSVPPSNLPPARATRASTRRLGQASGASGSKTTAPDAILATPTMPPEAFQMAPVPPRRTRTTRAATRSSRTQIAVALKSETRVPSVDHHAQEAPPPPAQLPSVAVQQISEARAHTKGSSVQTLGNAPPVSQSQTRRASKSSRDEQSSMPPPSQFHLNQAPPPARAVDSHIAIPRRNSVGVGLLGLPVFSRVSCVTLAISFGQSCLILTWSLAATTF